MLLPRQLLLLGLAARYSIAESTDTTSTSTDTYSTVSTDLPTTITGSEYVYSTVTGQITVETSSSSITTTTTNETTSSTASSDSQETVSTTSKSVTELVGTAASTNGTASATTSSAQATNTVPCNGYPEFCERKYSNITQVCAHNSAFSIKNNAASNQELSITDMLEDGVRMLQGETHWVNETVYNCHTSCDLLNAGPWQDELETARKWLEDNPYEVLTFLIVNSDFVSVDKYVPAIEAAGLLPYVYYPTYVPQYRDQWPTLGDMILSGQRMVFFMDYDANQTAVPYILDEFTHIWETPFSPTNQSFPCTIQRPPGLNETLAREHYMYLANHNLNVAIDLDALLGSTSDDETILIPNTAELNLTNGEANQYGRMGAMSLNCTADWSLPPNFLLVDYYNRGSPVEGSVFQVAAAANGVVDDTACCATTASVAPKLAGPASNVALLVALTFMVFLAW